MVEKIRFDSWKVDLLSKAGGLTLIKSSLPSIPNYFLFLFTIPTSVANKIEMWFNNFLWNDSVEHHRYHLVDWEMVYRSIQESGLGIRRIRSHNRVLLGNWLLRFGEKREPLEKSCGSQIWIEFGMRSQRHS